MHYKYLTYKIRISVVILIFKWSVCLSWFLLNIGDMLYWSGRFFDLLDSSVTNWIEPMHCQL